MQPLLTDANPYLCSWGISFQLCASINTAYILFSLSNPLGINCVSQAVTHTDVISTIKIKLANESKVSPQKPKPTNLHYTNVNVVSTHKYDLLCMISLFSIAMFFFFLLKVSCTACTGAAHDHGLQ